MRKLILLAVVLLVAGAVILVTLQPDTMMVERSASIGANQIAVFEYINDLHRWETWSPWVAMDPNVERTYGGPPTGVGATYAWKGNNKVGEGKMTITASVPHDRVEMHLEFLKPFASTGEVVFMINPAGSTHTLVSWTMQSKTNFVFKAMGLFVNMDAAVGSDFERGLAMLKTQLETAQPAAAPPVGRPLGDVPLPPQPAAR